MRKFLSFVLVLFAFQYINAEPVELLREGLGNTDWYYGAAKDYTGYTGGIKGQNQILKLQKWNASTGYSNASGNSHAVFTPSDATNPSSEFEFIINTLGYQNIHLSLGVFSWGAPKDHFIFEYSTNGTDYTAIDKNNLIDGTTWEVGKWMLVSFGDNLPESATLHVRIKDGTNEQIHFDDVVIKADPKPTYKSVLGDWETIFPANGVYPGKVHLFGLTSEVVDNPLPASTVNATSKVLKVTRPAGTWHLLGFELPGGLPVSKVKKIEFQVYSPVLKSVYTKLVGGRNTTLDKDSIFTSITFPWTKNSSAASGTDVINTDWNTITLNMYEANEDLKILSGEGTGKVIQVFVNPTSKTDPNSTWYPLEVDIAQQDFYIDNLIIYLNEEVLLDSVRVDKITLAKGATTRAVPAVFPLYTSADKNISWSTASSAVATVDATGLVTAVEGGSTKLQLSFAGNAVEGDVVVPTPATGISLDIATATIFKGATKTLTATVAPAEATNKNVIWTSSDEAIATVAAGVVTGVTEGTATITAKSEDGNFEATCEVTVKNKSVIINFEDAATTVGGWGQLSEKRPNPETAGINPSATSMFIAKTAFWHGATVTNFPGAGTSIQDLDKVEFSVYAATIPGDKIDNLSVNFVVQHFIAPDAGWYELNTEGTGPKKDGSNNDIKLTAISFAYNGATGVTLNPATWTKIEIPFAGKLKCTTKYWDANTNQAVINLNGKLWTDVPAELTTITNVQFAIDGGWVTNVNDGAVVRLAAGVYVDEITLFEKTVIAATGISLNKTATTINKGATETLTATVAPAEATNKNVIWTSSDETIATVANGLVTAVAKGLATITAKSVDGNFEATCSVEVKVAATGVELNKTATTINKGVTETLTATVAPADANNKNVIWTSSDEAIATVDNGLVTAVAKGSATITAKTEDGNFEATCTVEVKVAATGISLNATTASVDKDQTVTLTATVAPADANNQNVVWTSSNEAIATVADGVVTGVAKGTATITAKSEDGNFEATCEITVLDNTSTELVSANGIGLYPNPASDVVTVTVNENGTLAIFDLLGAQVASQQVFAGSQTVELNGLTAGTYMVQFKARSGKTVVSKLVVK